MKKIALLFPGQGSQYVGMGHDFFRDFYPARRVFEEADDLLKARISHQIFNGSEEDLKRTEFSQLAIFITSAAIIAVVHAQVAHLAPFVTLGLSLGEYSALYAAKRLTFQETLHFVKTRASAMERACHEKAGSMIAILGLSQDVVIDLCKKSKGSAFAANFNCPNHVVISGSPEGVLQVSEECLKLGAKRRILSVAGAFHSPFMQSAETFVLPFLKTLSFSTSPTAHISNVTGTIVTGNEEIRTLLCSQITSPVMWQKSITTCEENGVELYIEIGPGKTLSGLNKRIHSTTTLTLDKVEDLKSAELEIR